MGNSTCTLADSVVEACFIGAGRVRGNADMRLDRCLVQLSGFGIQLAEECVLYVTNCVLRNLTYGAFHTDMVFIRTTRINLVNSTIYGVPWVGPVKPKRTYERGMRYLEWDSKQRLPLGKALAKAWASQKQQPGVHGDADAKGATRHTQTDRQMRTGAAAPQAVRREDAQGVSAGERTLRAHEGKGDGAGGALIKTNRKRHQGAGRRGQASQNEEEMRAHQVRSRGAAVCPLEASQAHDLAIKPCCCVTCASR